METAKRLPMVPGHVLMLGLGVRRVDCLSVLESWFTVELEDGRSSDKLTDYDYGVIWREVPPLVYVEEPSSTGSTVGDLHR